MKKFLFIILFSFSSLFAFEHLDAQNIDEKLKGKNVMVDFYATWCPPCHVLAKNLIEFDKIKSSDVIIYKVDIDKNKDLAQKYNIQGLPTVVYFKDGKLVKNELGLQSVGSLIRTSKEYLK